MKILVDCRMKKKYIDYFERQGFEIIYFKSLSSIYYEVSSHVDIFFAKVDKKIICSESVKLDKDYGFIYSSLVECGYPSTAKYNVCITDSFAICNEKYIDKTLKEEVINSGRKIINVNQGYTKCSLICLSDKDYITTDISIKNKLASLNFNVLYIDEDNIKLLKEDGTYSKMNGFIGGATFVFDNKVVLFGDKNKLKNKDEFERFVINCGYELIDFEKEDIIDYGSALIID